MAEESVSRFRSGLIAAVIALMVVAGYGTYEHGRANRLAVQNQQIASTLQNTQTEIDALKTTVSSLNAQHQQAEAEAAKASHPLRRPGVAHARPVVRREDPRWRRFQQRLEAQNARLDEQQKSIESTRQDLNSTRTDLSGSIARTHDELVLLQKKGERNYYEFDLNKAKQFRPVGPVGIKLRKANTKHQFADLDLMVDDANLQKKHINLYEPVTFYAADSGLPVELVINNISKNHIRGYVSEPKYKRSQLSAMASTTNPPADANTTASSLPPQRQRLALPKD